MTTTAPALCSARLLGQYVPMSPQWHACRKNRVGGSDIAAILGLSTWDSRYSLWQRKAGRIPDKTDTDGMEWGRIHEQTIRAHFYSTHPECEPQPQLDGTWVHPRYDWALANPDGIVLVRGEHVLVEIKTADKFDAWEWGTPGTDEIPPYYLAQVRWYLNVLGLNLGFVAVLIGGNDYREYVVEPDPDDSLLMFSEAEAFIASLEAGRPPHLDEHKATYTAVRQLNPDVEDRAVEIDAYLSEQYAEATRDAKHAEARRQACATAVLDAMGTAKRAVTPLGDPLASRVQKGQSAPFLLAHPSLTRNKP